MRIKSAGLFECVITPLGFAKHCLFRTLLHFLLPLPSALAPFDPPKTGIFPRAAPILDFIWYPRATPRDASAFCFVASVRESPVQLLDASDGRVSRLSKIKIIIPCVIGDDDYNRQLRASYKIVDHRERQIGPHSLSFNSSADK